jgi:hypothetical protein
LFHPLLFEVHSLKLLSAHALVHSTGKETAVMTSTGFQETLWSLPQALPL